MFLLGFASKTLVFLQFFGRTWLVQWLFAVIYELYGIILEFFVLQLVQMKGWYSEEKHELRNRLRKAWRQTFDVKTAHVINNA